MRIGIVGATGLTGRTLLEILEKAPEKMDLVYASASPASEGKKLSFQQQTLEISSTHSSVLSQPVDMVFMTCSAELSKQWAPVLREHARWVIDLSSAFRMEKDIPLVVVGVNEVLLQGYEGLIANPNCSTIQLVKACHGIHQLGRITKLVVSTYQSISGMGQKGLNQLQKEEEGLLFSETIPLHHNVIPWIGPATRNPLCEEEEKIIEESQKIMSAPDMSVIPTTVRVPVPISHGEAVYVESEKPVSIEEIRHLWLRTPGIKLMNEVSCPVHSAHTNEVWISRLRKPSPNSLAFWEVADNLRVGSAWNAYQIFSLLAGRNPK